MIFIKKLHEYFFVGNKFLIKINIYIYLDLFIVYRPRNSNYISYNTQKLGYSKIILLHIKIMRKLPNLRLAAVNRKKGEIDSFHIKETPQLYL